MYRISIIGLGCMFTMSCSKDRLWPAVQAGDFPTRPSDKALDTNDSAETGEPDENPDSGETGPTVEETGEPAVDTGTPDTYEPTLTINEFMADNEQSWSPDWVVYPDWIEIYNPTDADIDLLGWSITDDTDEPERNLFAESLVVEAGGFLILMADKTPEYGIEHLSFSLSSDGEDIALYNTDGRRVDWVRFDEQLADVSAARVVDGSDEDGWQYVVGGTPGASNAGE